MKRRSRHRTLPLLAAAFLVCAAAPSAQAEDTPFGFIATASAHGMRSTYFLPGQFVVETIWDYGGPVAESRVDSSGGNAFASLPFPGESAIVAPGLVLNLAGLPSVPVLYPFYVSSQHPASPKSELADPTGNYRLASEADPTQAAAEAFFRGGPEEGQVARSESRSGIAQSGAVATATAESIAEGLSFGGVLTIGSAIARSTTILEPGKPLQGKAELIVNGARVAGQPVGMGPDGIDDKALNDVLNNAGISVRIVRAGAIDRGHRSDTLEVQLKHPVFEGGTGGTLTWRFGGAATTILGGGDAVVASDGTTDEATPEAAAASPGAGIGANASGDGLAQLATVTVPLLHAATSFAPTSSGSGGRSRPLAPAPGPRLVAPAGTELGSGAGIVAAGDASGSETAQGAAASESAAPASVAAAPRSPLQAANAASTAPARFGPLGGMLTLSGIAILASVGAWIRIGGRPAR